MVLVMKTTDWKGRRVERFGEMMSLNLLRWCLGDNLFSKLHAKCRQRGTSECQQGFQAMPMVSFSDVVTSFSLWCRYFPTSVTMTCA